MVHCHYCTYKLHVLVLLVHFSLSQNLTHTHIIHVLSHGWTSVQNITNKQTNKQEKSMNEALFLTQANTTSDLTHLLRAVSGES